MMSVYEQNRAKIPLEVMKSYDCQWVAFKSDGSSIIAGAGTLGELEQRLFAMGVDPEQVGFERIELGDIYLGGAELF